METRRDQRKLRRREHAEIEIYKGINSKPARRPELRIAIEPDKSDLQTTAQKSKSTIPGSQVAGRRVLTG